MDERFRVRHETNAEALDNWLIYYGGAEVTRPDRIGNNPNRKSSAQIETNLRWLEAMADPAAAHTHAVLSLLVLRILPNEKPALYQALADVYLFGNNYAAPERWRRAPKGGKEYAEYEKLEKAKKWLLERVGNQPLTVPDPEEAKGFVEKSRKRQKTAKNVYAAVLDRELSAGKDHAVADGQARQRAVKISGYSHRQLRRIIPPIKRRKRA